MNEKPLRGLYVSRLQSKLSPRRAVFVDVLDLMPLVRVQVEHPEIGHVVGYTSAIGGVAGLLFTPTSMKPPNRIT